MIESDSDNESFDDEEGSASSASSKDSVGDPASNRTRRHLISSRTLQTCLIGTFSIFIVLLGILIGLELFSSPTRDSRSGEVSDDISKLNSVEVPKKETLLYNDGSSRDQDPQWRVRPKHLHLVLIGDSIMHYQYLSLAYFLRTGRWFDPSFRKSHLTNVYSFESIFHDDLYGEFFFQTTRQLQPHEICDCVYPSSLTSLAHAYRFNESEVVINRYFHDPERNNTVRFFHAFGHQHDLQGRLDPQNIPFMEDGKEKDGLLNGKHTFEQKDIVWNTSSWADLVRDQIGTLLPKPQFMLLNAGKHSNDFGSDPEQVQQLHQSIQDAGLVRTFWRTTTYKNDGNPISGTTPKTDKIMCQDLGGCLSTEWTQHVNKNWYWDQHHNYEPVYRVINEDLLDSIGFLPNGYVKFNRTLLY